MHTCRKDTVSGVVGRNALTAGKAHDRAEVRGDARRRKPDREVSWQRQRFLCLIRGDPPERPCGSFGGLGSEKVLLLQVRSVVFGKIQAIKLALDLLPTLQVIGEVLRVESEGSLLAIAFPFTL